MGWQPRGEFLGPLDSLLSKKSSGKPDISTPNPGQTGVSIMSGMCNNGDFWQPAMPPAAHHLHSLLTKCSDRYNGPMGSKETKFIAALYEPEMYMGTLGYKV